MSEIQIVRVGDRGAGGEFLELPYSLHRASPYWVPPLRIAQKEILNTGKHPFYAHAEMRCFLARDLRSNLYGHALFKCSTPAFAP